MTRALVSKSALVKCTLLGCLVLAPNDSRATECAFPTWQLRLVAVTSSDGSDQRAQWSETATLEAVTGFVTIRTSLHTMSVSNR